MNVNLRPLLGEPARSPGVIQVNVRQQHVGDIARGQAESREVGFQRLYRGPGS